MAKIKVKCKVDLKQIPHNVLEKELKSRDYIVFKDWRECFDEASDDDLQEELERRNYIVYEDWSDCLDEASDDDLKEEMEDRGFDVTETIIYKIPEEKNVQYFELKSETLSKIKSILGLKQYHDKQRLLQEIDELYQ